MRTTRKTNIEESKKENQLDMISIVRNGSAKRVKLEEVYFNIQKGRKCREYYQKAYLVVDDNEYLILESLGRGGLAFVFLAYRPKKLTALKISFERQEARDMFASVKSAIGENYRDYFLNPMEKTVRVDGFYLGGVEDSNKIFFERDVFVSFWEPADKTLNEMLDEDFETKLKWFCQFMKGLSIIHSRDRAHFDIKLENLFLVGNQLKIGDFEFYFKIDDFIGSDLYICGTPGHIAPEMFYNRDGITTKLDIFSAGIAFIQLFIGVSAVPRRQLLVTPEDEDDMRELFLYLNASRYFKDRYFRENYKLYRYLRRELLAQLDADGLSGEEAEIYQLLLLMTEIDPGMRPSAEKILSSLTGAANDGAVDEGEEGVSLHSLTTVPCGGDPFFRMLRTHDKREVLKYCLVPDLLEKLREDGVKEKVESIGFEGDDYEYRFFSFVLLKEEIYIRLFGKDISSEGALSPGDWNMLVIVDYWNRAFKLGLEDEVNKKKIDKLLNGQKLDELNQSIFRSSIKATNKAVLKLRGKITET